MKERILVCLGTMGGFIATMLGGWDAGLKALIFAMIIDYITGIIVAGVFKKSEKSENGGLKSLVGWKGLAKKGVTLFIVLVAFQLDAVIGCNFIRNATIIAFLTNEVISITENAGLMGVPLPKPMLRAIDILKSKSEEDNNNEQ